MSNKYFENSNDDEEVILQPTAPSPSLKTNKIVKTFVALGVIGIGL